MNKKLLIVAIIGGFLLLAAVFIPYAEQTTGGFQQEEQTEEISLWDTYNVEVLASSLLILFGGFLAFLLGTNSFGALIPVGGFLSLVQGIQLYRRLGETSWDVATPVHWLLVAGGILAIVGTFGLGSTIIPTKEEKTSL